MGIGLATLIPENGNAAMEISDVDGVTVCGLTIDAGKVFLRRTVRGWQTRFPQTAYRKPCFSL